MELHQTTIFQQLESGTCVTWLLSMYCSCFLWKVIMQWNLPVHRYWHNSTCSSNGVELAKALYNEGASVFGWDMEWNMNYNINRYRYGGSAMFYRLNPKVFFMLNIKWMSQNIMTSITLKRNLHLILCQFVKHMDSN